MRRPTWPVRQEAGGECGVGIRAHTPPLRESSPRPAYRFGGGAPEVLSHLSRLHSGEAPTVTMYGVSPGSPTGTPGAGSGATGGSGRALFSWGRERSDGRAQPIHPLPSELKEEGRQWRPRREGRPPRAFCRQAHWLAGFVNVRRRTRPAVPPLQQPTRETDGRPVGAARDRGG